MRPRNFSPWAYWRLHLDAVEAHDPCPLDDLSHFEEWRDRLEGRVRDLLGPAPLPVPLDVEVLGVEDCGAYRRETVVYDSEAAMSVPAYLLVPHDRVEPGPAVLAIHGHGAGKTMVCGVDGGERARRDEIDEYRGDYAHELASRGFVVLAPDLRGFGERSDWQPPGRYGCDWNLVAATMAGAVPLAQNLWDVARSLDVLELQPFVDPGRLGVAGLSYGGTLALFLAATDTRVRAAVVSGYFSSWRAAHAVPWNMCGSQVLPGMLGALEHLDLACLVAPRALLVETGTEDLIFPLAAARDAATDLARVYEHLGAGESLVHDVFPGGHRWHGEAAYPFLDRFL